MSPASADADSAPQTRSRLWTAAVLIVLPFLGLLALQGYEVESNFSRVMLRGQRVAHSFDVIVSAQALRSALQDAERSQDGFLLTGQTVYLAPYRAGMRSVPMLLQHLGRLTASDPQHQRVVALDREVGFKLAEMRQTLAAYRHGGLAAAQKVVDGGQAFGAMRSIEATIDGMVAVESTLLTRRLQRETAAERAMERISLASSLLALALLVAGVLLAALVFRNARRLQREISQRAEEAASANRQLQERNVELARSGELEREAREQALRAEHTKSRFLATASHDLRQPLQALSMLNGALRRRVTEPPLADALQQQELAIGAMSRLLNALLDISKLESGAVKPQLGDFAVSGLLESLGREFRAIAEGKGLQLQIQPCSAVVHSDPALVEQILRNLLSNAIKYTHTGQVRLTAFTEAPGVVIEVADSGVGIAADQLTAIGEEFYQIGVPSNTTREGYGLGLSIVKRLVKLLDLSLDVRSEPGRGSTFTLRLPRGLEPDRTASVASAQPASAPGGGRTAHVLIVEDDASVRSATASLFQAEGYAVTAVASLDDALATTRSGGSVDLIVTDFHLPAGTTGLDVITRVRDVLRRPIKAVLITGDTSSAIQGLPRDPNLRVASKPLNPEAFLALVRELLTAAGA